MTKNQATRAATALVKRLKGNGWKPHVSTSGIPSVADGYYYGATMTLAKGDWIGDYTIRVYPSVFNGKTDFGCLIGQGGSGSGPWTGEREPRSSPNPNKAVSNALDPWIAYVSKQAALIEAALCGHGLNVLVPKEQR